MVVMDTTDLLEKLLDIRGGKAGRVMQGGELDRVAMEFNKLRHNASSIADHSLVKTLTPVSIYNHLHKLCLSFVIPE